LPVRWGALFSGTQSQLIRAENRRNLYAHTELRLTPRRDTPICGKFGPNLSSVCLHERARLEGELRSGACVQLSVGSMQKVAAKSDICARGKIFCFPLKRATTKTSSIRKSKFHLRQLLLFIQLNGTQSATTVCAL